MTDPLSTLERGLQRLVEREGFVRVAADGLAAFIDAPARCVLLLTDDPQRCPEAWDMVVVLPEALRALPGLRPGVADPAASRELAAAFGITRFPALLFLERDDSGHDYVGSIEGMRDWQPLIESLTTMRLAATRRRPGVGIPVRGTGDAPTCH